MSTQLSKWMIEDDGKIHKVVSFLTSRQASQSLGTSESSVFGLIGVGKLPATKIGDTWLIEPSALEQAKKKAKQTEQKASAAKKK